MQFGRYYEEFDVGATYRHWPGKTITEADDHLFCLITMNHHPLHIDANYAATKTEFKRNVVVGNLVYSLALGMSVADISGKAIANLEVESLKHEHPTFHGDTIYAETTVLDKRESLSKPDRGAMPPSLCGLRKARIGNPRRGKGKRGGFRYLYLYLEDRQHIHLLLLLDKDEQEDLTAEQRKQMRAMVTELKAKRRKEP